MKSCPQCSATYPDEYIVCPKDGARLVSESLWEPDCVIRGKYKVLEKIGEGGMATVYRAHHQLLDEPRALKVIRSDLARDEQFVRRFKNEAIITRKLQHPNAVRVDDLDIAEDGRPFIAMELVEGEGLKSLILRVGPLSFSQVVEIALQVCEALEAAHKLGLIHRDIKPDNIVLVPRRDSNPLVKILDFGIARLKEGLPGAGQAGMTLTGTGVVIGTPDYMSPEQAMGRRGDELDGRSDIYSLGIVMYRMLTGELPFKADTTVEMILHHIQTIPKPPNALKPQLGIPATISGIVMTALEKDREKRFASATLMAEALRQAHANLTLVTRAPAAIPTGPQEVPPPGEPQAASPASTSRARLEASRPQSEPVKMRPLIGWERGVHTTPSPPARPSGEEPRLLGRKAFRIGLAVLLLSLGIGVFSRRINKKIQPEPAPQASLPASETSSVTDPASTPSSSAPSPSSEPAPNTTGPMTQEPASPPEPAVQQPALQRSPAFPALPGEPSETSDASQVRRLRRNPVNLAGQAPLESEAERQEIRQLNVRAAQLLEAGDYSKAARLFLQVLKADPNNRHAQLGLQKCREVMRERRAGGRFRP